MSSETNTLARDPIIFQPNIKIVESKRLTYVNTIQGAQTVIILTASFAPEMLIWRCKLIYC